MFVHLKIVKATPDSCRYSLDIHTHRVHPLTPFTNISINQSTFSLDQDNVWWVDGKYQWIAVKVKMSLPHTKGTMQRRAPAVCTLQNTSALMTAVDTETFEPKNMLLSLSRVLLGGKQCETMGKGGEERWSPFAGLRCAVEQSVLPAYCHPGSSEQMHQDVLWVPSISGPRRNAP
ncbi:hypothetical protein NQZ68_005597 [Dissostichus eleginoides]|nr:hypothetical protein NQZ68_005597 [Dissostichus eleginoides]